MESKWYLLDQNVMVGLPYLGNLMVEIVHNLVLWTI